MTSFYLFRKKIVFLLPISININVKLNKNKIYEIIR